MYKILLIDSKFYYLSNMKSKVNIIARACKSHPHFAIILYNNILCQNRSCLHCMCLQTNTCFVHMRIRFFLEVPTLKRSDLCTILGKWKQRKRKAETESWNGNWELKREMVVNAYCYCMRCNDNGSYRTRSFA